MRLEKVKLQIVSGSARCRLRGGRFGLVRLSEARPEQQPERVGITGFDHPFCLFAWNMNRTPNLSFRAPYTPKKTSFKGFVTSAPWESLSKTGLMSSRVSPFRNRHMVLPWTGVSLSASQSEAEISSEPALRRALTILSC